MNLILSYWSTIAFFFVFSLFFIKSSLCEIPKDCKQWFKNVGVDLHSKNCLMKCETSSVGMSNFNCPQYCKDFCQKRRADAEEKCNKLKNMKTKTCREMTDPDRKAILKAADPKNFPRTRYKLGPTPGKSIEEETDCSTFVNEIYRRIGFEYNFANTKTLECVPTMHFIPESYAKPGDLILFDGHVGILASDGQVISATIGGRIFQRSLLDPDNPRFISSITKYDRKYFEKIKEGKLLKGKVLQWHCPKN